MGRPSTSFQKRKREIAKLEKRREKEARKEERKLAKTDDQNGPPIEMIDPADLGLPHLESLRSKENRLPEELAERFQPQQAE